MFTHTKKNARYSVTVTFNENNTITDIKINNSPGWSDAQREASHEQTRCHRVSAFLIREFLIAEYTGQTTATRKYRPVNPLFKTASDESLRNQLTEHIFNEYKKRYREGTNIFFGDPDHNRLAGKISMLLLRYVKLGKQKFDQVLEVSDGVFTLDLTEKFAFKKDPDFYNEVYRFFNTQYLEIRSWDELLELFFAANYDESTKEPQAKDGCRVKWPFSEADSHKIRKISPPTTGPSTGPSNEHTVCLFKAHYGYSEAETDPQASSSAPPPAKRARLS